MVGRTDWTALRPLSEDEIERIAAEDEDNPPTDADHWAQAKIGSAPVQASSAAKTPIHASFDRDVVEFFKCGGEDYRARMNAVLRRHMETEEAKKVDR